MSDNRNELDKLFENYEGSNKCKEFDTGRPVGKEYSPEISDIAIDEIAASDKRVAKMCKKIKKKQGRRGL